MLTHGRVAEEGTHEQLMAAGGIYQAMWEMQAAEDANGGPSKRHRSPGTVLSSDDGSDSDGREAEAVPLGVEEGAAVAAASGDAPRAPALASQ